MTHAKAYLKYAAYEALNGHFPMDKVIYYFKGFGCNKEMFEKITSDRLKARVDSFKWCNT